MGPARAGDRGDAVDQRPAPGGVVVVGVGIGPAAGHQAEVPRLDLEHLRVVAGTTAAPRSGRGPATITSSAPLQPGHRGVGHLEADDPTPGGVVERQRRRPRPGWPPTPAPVRRAASATPVDLAVADHPGPDDDDVSNDAIEGERVTRRSSTGLKASGSSALRCRRRRGRGRDRAPGRRGPGRPSSRATAAGSCDGVEEGVGEHLLPRLRREPDAATVEQGEPGPGRRGPGEAAVGVGEQRPPARPMGTSTTSMPVGGGQVVARGPEGPGDAGGAEAAAQQAGDGLGAHRWSSGAQR